MNSDLHIARNVLDANLNLDGSISCLKIFTKSLTLSQISHLKKCNEETVSSICPDGFEFFDGGCYQVSIRLFTFS